MESLKEYDEPIFLNDFSPSKPRLKYTYLHELSLPFKVEVYSYHHGNNLGSLLYAWKIPADPAGYDPTKSQTLISNIKKKKKNQTISFQGNETLSLLVILVLWFMPNNQ